MKKRKVCRYCQRGYPEEVGDKFCSSHCMQRFGLLNKKKFFRSLFSFIRDW